MGVQQGIVNLGGSTSSGNGSDYPQYIISGNTSSDKIFTIWHNQDTTDDDGLDKNGIDPYIVPFNGKITGALLVVPEVAIASATIDAGGANFVANLMDVNFASESLNTVLNFNVGTVNVGVNDNLNLPSNKIISIALDIAVTAGQALGLIFDSQDGDDVISKCRNPYIKLIVKEV